MKINKENLTNYLEMNGIDVSEMKWKELLSTYKQHKKDNEATITKDEIVDVVDKFVEDTNGVIIVKNLQEGIVVGRIYDTDVLRNQLIKDILELMSELKGKVRGTPEEIKIMFSLYNNFYKRNESPGCSQCVGNVYQKLLNIYKKYN